MEKPIFTNLFEFDESIYKNHKRHDGTDTTDIQCAMGDDNCEFSAGRKTEKWFIDYEQILLKFKVIDKFDFESFHECDGTKAFIDYTPIYICPICVKNRLSKHTNRLFLKAMGVLKRKGGRWK
jgi:hypothetical protein